MAISEANIKEWTQQAQETLQRAQALCTGAETLLKSMSYQLTSHLPELFTKCSQTVEGVKRQHEGVGKVIESIRNNVSSILEESQQKKASIEPVMKEFDQVLGQLARTGVPRFLIASPGATDSPKTLKDFISIDSIDRLRTEIDVYGRNTDKIAKLLLEEFVHGIQEPYKIASKNYSRIIKQYDDMTPLQLDLIALGGTGPYESHNLISTILKENASLENELVSILEMLTNHYDQCTQGMQAFNSGISSEFLQVLSNDSVELPEVLRELNTVCEIVHNNEIRASKFLNGQLPILNLILEGSDRQIMMYRSLRSTRIPKIMLLCDACKLIDSLPQHTETISQLSYHYNQFLKVYRTQYLSELHYERYVYPRKFLGKLTDFLNETLHQMQLDEEQRRKNWLVKYGEFIPKELSLPGDQNQPTIVEIITEGLEDIQKESDSAEQELVQFLKLMKASEPAR
ncbi:autophagy-related protein 17 [Suhomyces tanzawaensis NRRL Y-17324]|uniref:Autophagy-related protein 17 n=1 Tax=Suhomyces tanzawaensis NRRL Y-17324 TaxID=984487 RepID=A0A1E4SN20_9ASCO|nr:autophagy-related protein 17 [Suhomyces tanzawaensis NRRL Y-17324]ODV80817.1 autophagy-related protein 17 [Suhomyces tanzawaensis NRRL Y-17324]